MSVRGKVLLTRPSFDVATRYLAAYATELISYATDLGYTVIDMYDDQDPAPRNIPFWDTFEAENPDFIVFTGHGDTVSQRGQNYEDLVRINVNDDLMSGKIVNCLSCLTGAKLGPSMVSKTCKAYYGYVDEFRFVWDGIHDNDPKKDPYAPAFFDSAFTPVKAALIEKTPKEIFDSTLERFDYWWNYWYNQNDSLADDIMECLNWDRTAFTAITKEEVYATERLGLSQLLLPIGGITLGAAALYFLMKERR